MASHGFIGRVCVFGFVAAGSMLRGQAPTPENAHAVHGRVIDELGRPVAGAAVSAFASYRAVDTADVLAAPAVRAADDGSYRIAATRAPFVVIAALAEGRTVCTFFLRGDRQADAVMPDLLLLPGAVLTGRVLDPAGKPVVGARILATDPVPVPLARTGTAASGRADGQGRFAVPGVPRTSRHVQITAPGYFTETRFASTDQPLDVTLEPSGF